MAQSIYHERQVRELCALHALNNLFQSGTFTKAELDVICYSLSPDEWINPHKSVLGLGNYDINVIMKALQDKGYTTIWFDRRKDPNCLNLSNIFGFILNVPSDYKIGFVSLPLRRRHWITLKQINGNFYNLDSKLNAPYIIGREKEVLEYLKEELESKDKQLFLVVTNDVDKDDGWLLSRTNYGNHKQLAEREAEVLELKDIVSDDIKLTINPLCESNERH